MADREIVIQHFQDAIEVPGNNNQWRFVRLDIIKKALAMLKEPEPVKVHHLYGTKVTMHEELVFTDQCGYCGGYLLKLWKACPICGRKVQWND